MEQLLVAVLEGDRGLENAFVRAIGPVVFHRVSRVRRVHRKAGGYGLPSTHDLAQEAFALLFDRQARVLRRWDAARGLSLTNFIGLVAERAARDVLNSKRRTPRHLELTDPACVDGVVGADVDGVERQLQTRSAARTLQEQLPDDARGLLEALCAHDGSVRALARTLGVAPRGVYAARARLRDAARALRAHP